MEERNDAFDSAIREKLSGHEPAVPHALWTRISAELNESEEVATPAMPHIQAPTSATPWWRVAAAAAIVLTVGTASLLFDYHPQTEGSVASGIQPHVTTNTSAPVIQVQEAPQVAIVAAPAIAKKVIAPAAAKETPATTVTADNKTDNVAKELTAPATSESDVQLASSPAIAPANTIDMGNVPAFSLKRLSATESLNDEITIIKSAPAKKKHHKHDAEEETTRVIILNKKFDSQPGIRYQLPVRF